MVDLLIEAAAGYFASIFLAALFVFAACVVAFISDRLAFRLMLKRSDLARALEGLVGVMLIVAVALAIAAHVWVVYMCLKILFH